MNTGKPHIVMLATSLVAILLTLMIQACGNKLPSPEEVARKIDANEQLSQADYASMRPMLFGDYPSIEEIIAFMAELEKAINERI